uniref:CUB domain-containing protein n=1 Tax=Panagrolaimus sp. JU765 TaxID=591449 RepID=A0AC34PVA7_9BILA
MQQPSFKAFWTSQKKNLLRIGAEVWKQVSKTAEANVRPDWAWIPVAIGCAIVAGLLIMVTFIFVLLLFVGAFGEKFLKGGDIVLRAKSEGFQLKICQLKVNRPKFFFCMKGQPDEKTKDCDTDFCGFRQSSCVEVSIRPGQMIFPGFSKMCTWKPDENEKLLVKLELPGEYSLEVFNATIWKDVKSADSKGLPDWGLALIIIGVCVVVVVVAVIAICWCIKKCKKEDAPSEPGIISSKTRKNDDESKGNNQRKRKGSRDSVSSAFGEKLENGGDIVLRAKSEGFQLKICQLKLNGSRFSFCMKGQPDEKTADCDIDFCGFNIHTYLNQVRVESGSKHVPILTSCLEVSIKVNQIDFPGFSKMCTWKPDENEKLSVKLELPNEYSLEVIDATTWKDVKSADSAGLPTWGLALIIIGIVVIVVFVAASGICCYIKKCKKEGAPSELRIVPSKTRKNDGESIGKNQRKRKTSGDSASSGKSSKSSTKSQTKRAKKFKRMSGNVQNADFGETDAQFQVKSTTWSKWKENGRKTTEKC